MKVSDDLLVKFLDEMLFARQFEEKCIELNQTGRLPGVYHCGHGEEAVPVGIKFNMGEDILLKPHHRPHYYATICNGLEEVVAEMFGRATGMCNGKAYVWHCGNIKKNQLTVTGLLGSDVPVATGAAMAEKYKGSGKVVICFMGDGASNEGAVHEAMNFAAVFKLPMIFICHNNQWAMGTPWNKEQAIKDMAVRGEAYGMTGISIDGNDVIEVYTTVKEAIERAKKFEPTFIEARTYRVRNHFEGDPGHYRNLEDIKPWMEKDPIARLSTDLIQRNVISPDYIEKKKKEWDVLLEDECKKAEKAPKLPVEELLTLKHTYASIGRGEL